MIGSDLDLDADLPDADGQGFSLKAVLAFLTFFGFGGWITVSVGGAVWLAVIAGLVLGYTCMTLLAVLTGYIMRLGESGNRRVASVVGQTAEVYLLIPPSGQGVGRIHVRMDKRMVELEAVTKGAGLPSGSRVRVTEVIGDDRVVVEAVAHGARTLA